MRPILCGIETEYGLAVGGRGADHQLDDAVAFLDAFPGVGFRGWDNTFESPRSDLRGFKLAHLTPDPVDALYDANRTAPAPKGDWILANGGRFYNDHGHPEYATPECWSSEELALHDLAGEGVVFAAAKALEAEIGRKVSVYKNNTDFHGASYGTHESYLVPRSLGFERLYSWITPMLVARTALCGAGKVGHEAGPRCDYQLSQRADFLVESANAETLSRRPVFNTRDEPHADPAEWIRLHVISGDANRIASCTRRKVGLVQLAIALAEASPCQHLELNDPVAAFSAVSRHPDSVLSTRDGRAMDAFEILRWYIDQATDELDLSPDLVAVATESRALIDAFSGDGAEFARSVDWAAKKLLLEDVAGGNGKWDSKVLASYDLAYHEVDPDEGLFDALVAAGRVATQPQGEVVDLRATRVVERTRAHARSVAVGKFREHLVTGSWRSLVLRHGTESVEVELLPDKVYPLQLEGANDVGKFIDLLRGTHDSG